MDNTINSQLNNISQTIPNDINDMTIINIIRRNVNDNHKHCVSTGYEQSVYRHAKRSEWLTVAVACGEIYIDSDSLRRRNN